LSSRWPRAAGLMTNHLAPRVTITSLVILKLPVRWNILDNTITGSTWLHLTAKYKLNIFPSIKASSGEWSKSLFSWWCLY
jgi:hypothetical protein